MFKELLELVGDNERGKEIIASLQTTSENNVATINKLEGQVSDIASTRDKFKSGNSLVKSVLGLDEVNEDSLNAYLESAKKGKGDEQSIAEINNLKELLKQATDNVQTVTTGYESKLSTMALDNEIANSGVGASFSNEAMAKIGLGLIKSGATYEDGKIVYKKEDGSTLYNTAGTPMTISDKLSELKSDANYTGFFKPDTNSGGGTPPNQGGGDNNQLPQMNATEKMKQGRK